MPKTVAVLGPWGSGTTGVAQALSLLGCCTCPPHVHTNDPRTPNAFEPRSLRALLMLGYDENSLRYRGVSRAAMTSLLQAWLINERVKTALPIAAKHPLLCFYVPELAVAWRPLFIRVERALEDIEKSRLRRGWPPALGEAGARLAYQTIDRGCSALQLPFLNVDYTDLTKKSEWTVDQIIQWTGLAPSPEARARAVECVTR
jgi:hypothetical protein